MWSCKTTWSEGHVNIKMRHPLGKSISPAKFGGHTHCHSGDKMVLVCQMILHNRDKRVMRLYRWEPLMISHYSAKCHGHIQCDSREIMVLYCSIISKDLMTIGSGDFIGESPLC